MPLLFEHNLPAFRFLQRTQIWGSHQDHERAWKTSVRGTWLANKKTYPSRTWTILMVNVGKNTSLMDGMGIDLPHFRVGVGYRYLRFGKRTNVPWKETIVYGIFIWTKHQFSGDVPWFSRKVPSLKLPERWNSNTRMFEIERLLSPKTKRKSPPENWCGYKMNVFHVGCCSVLGRVKFDPTKMTPKIIHLFLQKKIDLRPLFKSLRRWKLSEWMCWKPWVLDPNEPCFDWEWPSFGRFKPQNRRQTDSNFTT